MIVCGPVSGTDGVFKDHEDGTEGVDIFGLSLVRRIWNVSDRVTGLKAGILLLDPLGHIL